MAAPLLLAAGAASPLARLLAFVPLASSNCHTPSVTKSKNTRVKVHNCKRNRTSGANGTVLDQLVAQQEDHGQATAARGLMNVCRLTTPAQVSTRASPPTASTRAFSFSLWFATRFNIGAANRTYDAARVFEVRSPNTVGFQEFRKRTAAECNPTVPERMGNHVSLRLLRCTHGGLLYTSSTASFPKPCCD